MLAKIKKLATFDKIFLAFVIFIALWLTLSSIGVMTRNYDLQRQVNQSINDNEIIALENENLKLQRAYYQTDEFLELQARALLGRALPGEKVLILPKTTAQKTTLEQKKTIERQDNFSQWMEFLFGAGEKSK